LKSFSLNYEPKEPSVIQSVILAGVLYAVLIGFSLLIGNNWAGSMSDLENFLSLYQFGAKVVITLLAVPGLDPEKKGLFRYVGVFIFSLIPIAGWFVLYWAGKGLARSLSRSS